ncbi:O-methyltransferase [Aspergillus japonicus CBS 114.51]|uniref:O-methyltransferase n=1 Tax=Aspergillus japonicus CBS 114.51 TaxID=1448312 RepID=A0A8T8WZF5_ASPJA|nr:O-methyltransferase [Aspergillus japonicus CBS 114.51]RAH81161.1 O-methyltransferase [Aspergillus japonicus CBS 114.51]
MPSNESYHNDSSMETEALLRQVNQAANAFNESHGEADRLKALRAAQELVTAFQKPQDAVYNLAYSPTHVMCVRIAIDLEIFTTLSERGCPTRLEELAAVKDADPILTERVLRILTSIGYVAEHDVRMYMPTAMTRQMTDRLSLAVVRFIFDVGMPTLAKVPEFLRTTEYRNPSGPLNGAIHYAEKMDTIIWEWLATKPGYLDACNTFMEADRGSRPSWLEWFPVQEQLIEGYQKGDSDVLLVDVAGGRGHDIAAFQTKFPDAPGRLVLEDLSQVLESAVVHPKIEHVPFDLFKPQPIQGARTYYLKFILHDWSDEDCRRILRHVGAAMKKGYSKLIIEEFVLADRDCAMLPAMWDWEMLIFCNSMERTADRWRKLICSAGFQIVKFWPPPGDGQGLIEAELE